MAGSAHILLSRTPPWSLAQSTTAHCGLRWVEAWEAAKRPGVLGDCLPAKSSTLLPAPWTSAPAPLPSSSWPSPVGPATLRPPATLPPSTSNFRQPPRLVPSSKTGPSGSRLVRPSLPGLRASPAPCLSPLQPAGQQPARHTRDAHYRSPSPASPVIWFCFRCFVLVIVLAAELRTHSILRLRLHLTPNSQSRPAQASLISAASPGHLPRSCQVSFCRVWRESYPIAT